ncbi:MAG: hypothetical protein JW908_16840 [Anaerolineales bacterium]|nr:hypothetical protein [Anaerolineales bacterium]
MKPFVHLRTLLLLFAMLVCTAMSSATTSMKLMVTLSGAITHGSNPVSNVAVQSICDGVSQWMTTGLSGTYSFSVTDGSHCMLFVRPPIDMRLAFRNWGTTISGNTSKDFELVDGYRLQGEFHTPDGSTYNESFWMGLSSFFTALPDGEWLGETAINGAFDMVIPAVDIYRLNMEAPPYYVSNDRLDMRFGDMTGVVITLLDAPCEGVPSTPPDASRITVSDANVEGIADIQGLEGAVPPSARVIVVNLNSRNIVFGTSNTDGSFSVSLFAPSGSAILVKYDIDGWRTKALINEIMTATSAVTYLDTNPLPGTIINVGPQPVQSANQMDFYLAGNFAEEPSPSYPGGRWAGWWMTGKVVVPPGNPALYVPLAGQVQLTDLVMHVSSPAMNCTNPPTLNVTFDVALRYLFDINGKPLYWGAWFTSQLFTPTGLPIEHESLGERRWMPATVFFNNFTCDNTHAATSTVQSTSFNLPGDMPAGIYQIVPNGHNSNVPLATSSQAPMAIIWNYQANASDLPPLIVGDPAAPHTPWTLMGNYVIDGRRGVQAVEDQGSFIMVNRVVYPGEKFVLPARDARTGQLLTYRLEPGSYWISGSDRRFPNPPRLALAPSYGELMVNIQKPDGEIDVLGPAQFSQTSVRTPTTQNGSGIAEGTGQIDDLYHLTTRNETFDYQFSQYGNYRITLNGVIHDIYGLNYQIDSTYEIVAARVLDIDPAQLPTTPYVADNYFAPGVHVYPPFPAEVSIAVTQPEVVGTECSPDSFAIDIINGQANHFGYFFPPPGQLVQMECPGEFRVDIQAIYTDTDGTLWVGNQTWGSVIEKEKVVLEAHGRRGMDYTGDINPENPFWFYVQDLPTELVGIENYYPYWSGDIHWGSQDIAPGDSIHTILTFKDLTSGKDFYGLLEDEFPKCQTGYRWPPSDVDAEGLRDRINIDEAPLCISTTDGKDAVVFPDNIHLWGYWYGSSERPDVHVRELISEDNMGTAYWRFNDTYNMQIGEGAKGDLPLDLKWEFGGIVFRLNNFSVNEYAIYSSLWTLLPDGGDAYGYARVTAPFRGAGALNGGPIMNLQGKNIDMLFLPKGVRPGDILEVGDTIAFSGHVGPPLNAHVDVTITSPDATQHSCEGDANKIGWFYKHTCDFIADEPGRWLVDVQVEFAKEYVPTGQNIKNYNQGTVLGTNGQYEFYVVPSDANRLEIVSPKPGFLPWVDGRAQSTNRIQPVVIQGIAPAGTTSIHYTIYDKGMVMGQGEISPESSGLFSYTYDAQTLQSTFPMLSLWAHEGLWEGLADEVSIHFLATGTDFIRAASVTLIGEEVFVDTPENIIYLPVVIR